MVLRPRVICECDLGLLVGEKAKVHHLCVFHNIAFALECSNQGGLAHVCLANYSEVNLFFHFCFHYNNN